MLDGEAKVGELLKPCSLHSHAMLEVPQWANSRECPLQRSPDMSIQTMESAEYVKSHSPNAK